MVNVLLLKTCFWDTVYDIASQRNHYLLRHMRQPKSTNTMKSTQYKRTIIENCKNRQQKNIAKVITSSHNACTVTQLARGFISTQSVCWCQKISIAWKIQEYHTDIQVLFEKNVDTPREREPMVGFRSKTIYSWQGFYVAHIDF